MDSKTKVCQNCKNEFIIEPEDFDFYEKMKVPAPTFCWTCRMQRRMAWRNERALYRRKCNAPGHDEMIVSIYAPDQPYTVYDAKYWWSDAWDPMSYGADYDFSKSFFMQFKELMARVPILTLTNINSVNSDYTNFVESNKNCYLLFSGGFNENVHYTNKPMESKDSLDCYILRKGEMCYECINCSDSYRLFYSRDCRACNDSYLLSNCRNCSNCFGCVNLISKSFCIWNEQYSREDYMKELKELGVDNWANLQKLKEKYYNTVVSKAIHRYATIIGSTRCTGDNILNSKNAQYCFDIPGETEDSKFLEWCMNSKDIYDSIGLYKTALSYENVDNNRVNNNMGTITIYDSAYTYYDINCHNCNNIFGCIGLRKKEYCILNKQYTKEEYQELLPRIVKHMTDMPYVDKRGRVHNYGDFFPAEFSPFAYNDTIAQEYFPLTQEEALREGFVWRPSEEKKYDITMPVEKISDRIADVGDGILDHVLGCAHAGKCNDQCTTAFKITSSELSLYRKLNVPLPHLCPNCRHYERLCQRNPMKLWHRQCMCDKHHSHHTGKCANEFETPYAPEREEIIYCEQCYQQEVL